MLSFLELHFNVGNGYLKVLVCGFKMGLLWKGDYVTLVQCVTAKVGQKNSLRLSLEF
uniref:Uncharacterized protein n=1 Tax=Melopsittacus undulatus TaxID=13146 RepID=A0A8V5GSR7_MELUD